MKTIRYAIIGCGHVAVKHLKGACISKTGAIRCRWLRRRYQTEAARTFKGSRFRVRNRTILRFLLNIRPCWKKSARSCGDHDTQRYARENRLRGP
jgi:hypothetical protein